MKLHLTFDDVLLSPKFSHIKSRADVNLSQRIFGRSLKIPVISSNMDTVTGVQMSHAMQEYGGVSALHRFQTIDENVDQFLKSNKHPIVSFGIGQKELDRLDALHKNGATAFLLDVAHGASIAVVEQALAAREIIGTNSYLIVGNFANKNSLKDFIDLTKNTTDAYKIGIGPGSACTTRVVTGCGGPCLASLLDCAPLGVTMIADGGMRNSGDIAKALAAGASAVMLGGMLAGTEESPGGWFDIDTGEQVIGFSSDFLMLNIGKKYRGSASTESYEVQGKVASHRSHEGDSFFVPYKGSVAQVLQQIEGGIRSALSYTGSYNLEDLKQNAEFIQITGSGLQENKSHGRKS